MRQKILGTTKPALTESRFTQAEERKIVEPMEKAITIYKQLNDEKQVASANFQLGAYYARVWTRQRDDTAARSKLNQAFMNLERARQYFFLRPGEETTAVAVSIEMSNLFTGMGGDNKATLKKGLECILNVVDAFSPSSADFVREDGKTIDAFNKWKKDMEELAKKVKGKVEELALKLARAEKNEGDKNGSAWRQFCKTVLKFGVSEEEAVAAVPFPIYDMLKKLKEDVPS